MHALFVIFANNQEPFTHRLLTRLRGSFLRVGSTDAYYVRGAQSAKEQAARP
jgi:hypothetical protein